jgi:SAM-dependent methyltransferase
MTAARARRWLVICSIAACTACGSDATAPRRVVSPGERPPPSASSPSAAPSPTVAPTIAPIAEPPPAAAPTVEPPPAVEPVVTLPPCPDDPQRDAEQKPDHVVGLAELSGSMTVVDLGSGNGYFLCRLSRAVGSHGHVVATEVDKQLVRELKNRIAREQLSNVEVIHAPATDIGIAPGTADRILVVNVWHHLPDRKRYATRVARALSPRGKVVVVDFKPERRRNGHGIAPERVLAELAAGGIDGALVADDLPDQYVIIGSRHAPTNDAHTR